MRSKSIFFLLLSSFLCISESFKVLSVTEFQEKLSDSKNKKVFLENYSDWVKNSDKDVNSIISLYETNQLYRSYVYGRNKDWRGVPILLKDNIDAKGLANTAGSISMTDNFPRSDAHLVKNLKKLVFLFLEKLIYQNGLILEERNL